MTSRKGDDPLEQNIEVRVTRPGSGRDTSVTSRP